MVQYMLPDYIYQLVFTLDNDAPDEYMERWIEIKSSCENGEVKDILNMVKSYCKLETNKNLPILDRVEGGLGGADNQLNKQIRFETYSPYLYDPYKIVLNDITDGDNEKWTHQELDDLIISFRLTFNKLIGCKAVNGSIVLIQYVNIEDY